MNVRMIRDAASRARLGACAVVGVVLLVAGGCSSGDGGDGSEDDSAPSKTGTSDSPAKVSGDTGDLDKPKGAIDALSGFDCEADADGVWSATGTLTNTTTTASRYLVSVSIIKSKTSEVLGKAEKTLRLDAGDHGKFEFTKLHNRAGRGMLCVPRVISGK